MCDENRNNKTSQMGDEIMNSKTSQKGDAIMNDELSQKGDEIMNNKSSKRGDQYLNNKLSERSDQNLNNILSESGDENQAHQISDTSEETLVINQVKRAQNFDANSGEHKAPMGDENLRDKISQRGKDDMIRHIDKLNKENMSHQNLNDDEGLSHQSDKNGDEKSNLSAKNRGNGKRRDETAKTYVDDGEDVQHVRGGNGDSKHVTNQSEEDDDDDDDETCHVMPNRSASADDVRSPDKFGRVIMIDGVKFVAVTSQRPPRGNCRTCKQFGSLLYFSARSAYHLEAAEKFCSVYCARTFLDERRLRKKHPGTIHVTLPKMTFEKSPDKPTKKEKTKEVTNTRKKSTTPPLTASEKSKKSKVKIDPAALAKLQRLCDIYQKSIWMQSKSDGKMDDTTTSSSEKKRCDSATTTRRCRSKTHDPQTSKSATTLPKIFPVTREFPKPDEKSQNKKDVPYEEGDKVLVGAKNNQLLASREKGTKRQYGKRRTKSLGTPERSNALSQGQQGSKDLQGSKCDAGDEKLLAGNKTTTFRFPHITSKIWQKGDMNVLIGPRKGSKNNVSTSKTTSPGNARDKKVADEKGHTPKSKKNRERQKFKDSTESDGTALAMKDSADGHVLPNAGSAAKKSLTNAKLNQSPKDHSPAISSSPMLDPKRLSFTPRIVEIDRGRVPRDKDPTHHGTLKRNSSLTGTDGNKSQKLADGKVNLGQFHDRMRSRFKTMFPLIKKTNDSDEKCEVAMKAKSTTLGEETPSQTSINDDISNDVEMHGTNADSIKSVKVIRAGTKHGAQKEKCGLSSASHGSITKQGHQCGSAVAGNGKDDEKENWTNLLKFMMEAADREHSERFDGMSDSHPAIAEFKRKLSATTVATQAAKASSTDKNDTPNVGDGAGIGKVGADSSMMQECVSLAKGAHMAIDNVEGCDDGYGERKKKKKKKKKRKKNKKEKEMERARKACSSRNHDGEYCTASVNGNSEVMSTTSSSRKRKKKSKRKKHQYQHQQQLQQWQQQHLQQLQQQWQHQPDGVHMIPLPPVPPDSPPSQMLDPDAWPKWVGDGRTNKSPMSSVDMLLWTMKNDFQPEVSKAVKHGIKFHSDCELY